jgi:hypothetical protein
LQLPSLSPSGSISVGNSILPKHSIQKNSSFIAQLLVIRRAALDDFNYFLKINLIHRNRLEGRISLFSLHCFSPNKLNCYFYLKERSYIIISVGVDAEKTSWPSLTFIYD